MTVTKCSCIWRLLATVLWVLPMGTPFYGKIKARIQHKAASNAAICGLWMWFLWMRDLMLEWDVCRVLRDVIPPTPPGPEGSNGNGPLRAQWVARYIFIAAVSSSLLLLLTIWLLRPWEEEVRLVRVGSELWSDRAVFLGENGWRCVNAGSFVIVLYSGSDFVVR